MAASGIDVASAAAKQRTARQQWFRVHSWLGLKLCVFMAFITFTGALATVSQEIDWLLNPEMRVSAPASGQRLSAGAMLDGALASAHEGRIVSMRLRGERWFAAELLLITPWNERVRLWVDPYTGELTGSTGWFNVQRFLRQIHRHLMMPTQIGVPLVSMLGIVLLLSMISGLVVYKRFWRGFLNGPRWHKKARVWLGDLHRLTGLWSLWFVALMAVTSVWYLVESLGGNAAAVPRPAGEGVGSPGHEQVVDGATLDRAWRAAERRRPGLVVRRIVMPSATQPAFAFQGQGSTVLVRDRANAVWVDGTGAIVGDFHGETLTLHQRISEAADPLHFGTWAGENTVGLFVKLVWFVAGLAMVSLSLGGIAIYGSRVVANEKRGRR